jgi:integrase
MKLDVKTIKTLRLPEGSEAGTSKIFWDELKGFGLRLDQTADGVNHNWIVQYRNQDGRSRRKTIGSLAVVDAVAARAEAKRLLAQVELGRDPAAERTKRREEAAKTFASVVEKYLVDREPNLETRSHEAAGRYLQGGKAGHYFKALYSKPITQITRLDVSNVVLAIKTERGSTTADAARSALSAFFGWAMEFGHIDANPVTKSYRPVENKDTLKRDRVLSDVELAEIWKAAELLDNDYGRIIRLLILLGNRRDEVGEMPWSELDLISAIWDLPGERTKNKRSLRIALPAIAVDIVKGAWKGWGHQASGGLVFRDFHWSRDKTELDAMLGDKVAPWTVHDLRRTMATRMGDHGVLPHVVEAILNHQSGSKRGVAGVYNRSPYEAEAKQALKDWADRVVGLVAPAVPAVPAVPAQMAA